MASWAALRTFGNELRLADPYGELIGDEVITVFSPHGAPRRAREGSVPIAPFLPAPLYYISPEMFGGVGNGNTDDTAALVTAGNQAVAKKLPLRLFPGRTYLFKNWDIPAGCILEATGATLRSDGTTVTATDPIQPVQLRLSNGCRFDNLTLSTPGTELNTDIIEIEAGVVGDSLTVLSDVQRGVGGVGITAHGQGGIISYDPNDIRIGTIRTVNIDRPLHLYNVVQPVATPPVAQPRRATGTVIGFLDVTSYLRGFRADFCSFVLGGARMSGVSPHAVGFAASEGHDGVLLAGCALFKMGDLWIADATEHAFRIGGSPLRNLAVGSEPPYTGDFEVGTIDAYNCAGCSLKINPTTEFTLGVTEKCRRATFGFITGYNVGRGFSSGNRELLRLTHLFQGYIAGAYAQTGPDNTSAEYLLRINDCNEVVIGDLGGEGMNAGFIAIDGASDAAPPPPTTESPSPPPASYGGDVVKLRINRLWGECHPFRTVPAGTETNDAIRIDTRGWDSSGVLSQVFNVGDISIGECHITGWLGDLVNWAAGVPAGAFDISGSVYGNVAPTITTGADSVRADIKWRSGWAALAAFDININGPGFHVFDNEGLPAAQDNYGGGIIMSRLGSRRRGAAIVGRQFTAAQESFGLDFFVSSTSPTSDALLEAFRITHQGALQIRNSGAVPATTAGWNSIFIDPLDGNLKIKFASGLVKIIAEDSLTDPP